MLKCIFLMLCLLSGLAHADLLTDLQDGHHIILMRHANAPGNSDPSGYKLDDCSTQRNLDDHGRQQARNIGLWLKENGIHHARVLSSPWCRCVDTARLIDLGDITTYSDLGSFYENPNLAKNYTAGLRRIIQSELAQHTVTPIIIVTHQVNIDAYTNETVRSGGMLLVTVRSDGSFITQMEIHQNH